MGTSAGGGTHQRTSPLLHAAEPQGWLPSKHAGQAGWRQGLCTLYNNLQRGRTPEVEETLIHILWAEGLSWMAHSPRIHRREALGGVARHLGCL